MESALASRAAQVKLLKADLDVLLRKAAQNFKN
jgi:hypothetical protein